MGEERESKLVTVISIMQSALERIAVGKRSDGTYNLGREACEDIAKKALADAMAAAGD